MNGDSGAPTGLVYPLVVHWPLRAKAAAPPLWHGARRMENERFIVTRHEESSEGLVGSNFSLKKLPRKPLTHQQHGMEESCSSYENVQMRNDRNNTARSDRQRAAARARRESGADYSATRRLLVRGSSLLASALAGSGGSSGRHLSLGLDTAGAGAANTNEGSEGADDKRNQSECTRPTALMQHSAARWMAAARMCCCCVIALTRVPWPACLPCWCFPARRGWRFQRGAC